jgi:hypothetical protein
VSHRPCLVYLVGEGPSDIGALALNQPYSPGSDGFMQPILRKLGPAGLELEFQGQKVSRLGRFGAKPRLPGHGERAAKALALAAQARARVLVYVVDLDKTSGQRATATERRQRLQVMRAEIEAGFQAARARDPDAATILCVTAVPIRMIEAWALADPKAVEAAAERFDSDECRQPPEALWGRQDDPKSDFPKHVLRRALGCDASAGVLAAIAEAAAIDRLRSQCPESFGPFCEDVARAIEDCRSP